MPQRLRHDAYGRPLPTVVEGGEAGFQQRPENVEQCRFIQRVLEQYYQELLQPGVWAEVTLGFYVKDGVLTKDAYLTITRQWREEASRVAR